MFLHAYKTVEISSVRDVDTAVAQQRVDEFIYWLEEEVDYYWEPSDLRDFKPYVCKPIQVGGLARHQGMLYRVLAVFEHDLNGWACVVNAHGTPGAPFTLRLSALRYAE